MTDKIFVDTNILLYSVSTGDRRCDIARETIIKNAEFIVISSQVINEFINICLKKKILAEQKTYIYAFGFMDIFEFIPIGKAEIEKAISIKIKYKYSYWDSLIIACALGSNSKFLYTEDLQHSQKIEDKLTIFNPFKKEV